MKNQETNIILEITLKNSVGSYQFDNQKDAIEYFQKRLKNDYWFYKDDRLNIKEASYWNRETNKERELNKNQIKILENKINNAIEKLIAE